MWLLFVPLAILVALAVLALMLVGAVFGLLGAAWPWLLIAAGVWLFWHHDGPRRRDRRAQRGWAGPRPVPSVRGCRPHQASVGRSATPARLGTQAPAAKPSGPPELPIDVRVKVEQIQRKVEVLLGYADRFPPFSKDLYLVRQTATEYLPRTVDAFLRLPAESVEVPAGAGGKTPLQELRDQLDLLDKKLDEIASDLQRQDLDHLLANRRFLEERFRPTRPTRPAGPGAAEMPAADPSQHLSGAVV